MIENCLLIALACVGILLVVIGFGLMIYAACAYFCFEKRIREARNESRNGWQDRGSDI